MLFCMVVLPRNVQVQNIHPFVTRGCRGTDGSHHLSTVWLYCPGSCRYTAFILLYPVGVVAEMALIFLALPTLEADGRWTLRMPNAANWTFEYSTFLKVGAGGSPR